MWPFNAKKENQIPHITPLEMAYVEGFNRGFETGFNMASEVDKTAFSKVREKAIEDTLVRMNGNHKKNI